MKPRTAVYADFPLLAFDCACRFPHQFERATMLHGLGIDHARFSHKLRGLNVRLTGVEEAHVVKDILT